MKTQANNPNAPDRRKVICKRLRLLAAGDWERYVASARVIPSKGCW